MIKVEALNTYKKLSVKDEILNRIPEEGEQFEITNERLDILLGNNSYNTAFVKLVNDDNIEADTEVTEEVVQSVAEAIVEQAEEENKSVEEVVTEIVEEATENNEIEPEDTMKKEKKNKDSKK